MTKFAAGDEVLGWSEERSAQAEYVVSRQEQLVAKPPALDWYRAGSLKVVAATAGAAVRAVSLKPGDTVAISGAAGGVGSLAVQLAQRTGARVIGIASAESAPFLRSVGVARTHKHHYRFRGGAKGGAKTDGSVAANTRETLASVANAIAWGDLVMPLTAIIRSRW